MSLKPNKNHHAWLLNYYYSNDNHSQYGEEDCEILAGDKNLDYTKDLKLLRESLKAKLDKKFNNDFKIVIRNVSYLGKRRVTKEEVESYESTK